MRRFRNEALEGPAEPCGSPTAMALAALAGVAGVAALAVVPGVTGITARHAPKALPFPFTGLAPASRWAGTRSRAGSL
ncbi:hypothetical protein GCM10010294_46470 [Streptomyces griseoloalbus]|nr:hypothetical protein GCM10010294_46470 [Streptomyces griseoloalbus]